MRPLRLLALSALLLLTLLLGAACKEDGQTFELIKDEKGNLQSKVTDRLRITPKEATFDQNTFTTTYTLNVSIVDEDISTLDIDVDWSGPNCDTWHDEGDERDPKAGDWVDSTMKWTHKDPPCTSGPDHRDVTVKAEVEKGGWLITCSYVGAATGNGKDCVGTRVP